MNRLRELPTYWPATIDIPRQPYDPNRWLAQTVQAHYIGVTFYFAAALGLAVMAFARFDRVADRPRRA